MEKFKKDYLNKQFIFAVILTIISAFIMAVGVKIFISPNKFLSTGVTGIAIIFGRLYDNMHLSDVSMETTITGIMIFLLNIPLFILSWKKLSHKFAILTVINVLVNSIFLTILPDNLNETFHLVAESNTLVENITLLDAALFVGMMNGAANALSYIVGGSTGGCDILSMYYSMKRQSSIGKITTVMNFFILFIGIFIDGTDSALSKSFYTLVYLVISSIVIDLFYIRNKRAILFITTEKGKEIVKEITEKFVRGVTFLDAKGGYTGAHKDLLYCACASFEVVDIVKKVKEIDDHAFISVVEANKVHGNFLNKELR